MTVSPSAASASSSPEATSSARVGASDGAGGSRGASFYREALEQQSAKPSRQPVQSSRLPAAEREVTDSPSTGHDQSPGYGPKSSGEPTGVEPRGPGMERARERPEAGPEDGSATDPSVCQASAIALPLEPPRVPLPVPTGTRDGEPVAGVAGARTPATADAGRGDDAGLESWANFSRPSGTGLVADGAPSTEGAGLDSRRPSGTGTGPELPDRPLADAPGVNVTLEARAGSATDGLQDVLSLNGQTAPTPTAGMEEDLFALAGMDPARGGLLPTLALDATAVPEVGSPPLRDKKAAGMATRPAGEALVWGADGNPAVEGPSDEAQPQGVVSPPASPGAEPRPLATASSQLSHDRLPVRAAGTGERADQLTSTRPITAQVSAGPMRLPAEEAQSSPAMGANSAVGADPVSLRDLPARIVRLAGELREAGPSEVRLRLDPSSMGEVRIRIESTRHGIEVRIVAQSQEACVLLNDGQPWLREELARHGVSLQSFSTSVAAEGGHGMANSRHQANRQHSHSASANRGRVAAIRPEEEQILRRSRRAGALDTKV
jgi:hypothetical protein